jgi:small-conductance mechanosensitive channel
MNFQVVIDALTKIVTDIINFIPNLVNGLIILFVGYFVARLVRWILTTVLRRLRFDALIERTGMNGALHGLGVKAQISQILAQIIFVLLLLSFLITSTRLMGLEAVARLLEELLSFLPNLIAAVIIFMLGGVAAQFVGNLITTVGAASGITYAARLGRLVQYLISVFVVVLALGQLGLDTAILVTAITIVIAAFGLALGLGLGLGSRSIIYNALAGYYVRQRFPIGHPVIVDDVRGVISRIGGVNTVLTALDGGSIVVPNSFLLESLVRSPRPPAPPPPTAVP